MILLLLPTLTQAEYGITSYFINTSGDKVNFDVFEGKPLVVEAFATWCSHCQREHKELVKLWNEYNDSINLLSLSVASDDNLDTIADYLIDYPSTWPVGWDRDEGFDKQFKITAFPTIFLFDGSGRFGSCDVGERSFETLSGDVDRILADPQEYIDSFGSSGKCEEPSFFEQIPTIVWLGLLVSASFTTYYIIKVVKSRKSK